MNLNKNLSSKTLLGIGGISLFVWTVAVYFDIKLPSQLEFIGGIIGMLGFVCLFFGFVTWLFESRESIDKVGPKPNHKINLFFIILAIPAILIMAYVILILWSLSKQ